MRARFVAVGFDPGNLGFEQRYAGGQFVLRIGAKILGSEAAGGIP